MLNTCISAGARIISQDRLSSPKTVCLWQVIGFFVLTFKKFRGDSFPRSPPLAPSLTCMMMSERLFSNLFYFPEQYFSYILFLLTHELFSLDKWRSLWSFLAINYSIKFQFTKTYSFITRCLSWRKCSINCWTMDWSISYYSMFIRTIIYNWEWYWFSWILL
jgi:hypothetical protein